jgi:hypothetical protein
MRIRKWLMKQQWRIVQIRGIWSLFYGVLLLAYAYFEFIPFFAEMGILGPFIFAATLLVVFLILGYIYDRVLVMWAPSQEVIMERNPFQYVPSPKDHIYWLPVYSTLLDVADSLAVEAQVDRSSIHEVREYFSKLITLNPERKEDIEEGARMRAQYVSEHPFPRKDGQ